MSFEFKKKLLKKKDFNLRLYLEKELGQIIKKDNNESEFDLFEIMDKVDLKKREVTKIIDKFENKVLKKKNEEDKFEQKRRYRQFKKIERDFSILKKVLKEKDEKMEKEIKNIKRIYKKSKDLIKEKVELIKEMNFLKIIKRLKINKKCEISFKNFEEKLIFTQNSEKIENHLIMYEKDLLFNFYEIKQILEEEYKEILETDGSLFLYSGKIIDHFFNSNLEKIIFEIIIRNNILEIDFDYIPNSFNKENIDNIRMILEKFIVIIEKYFEKKRFSGNTLINFLNEKRFSEFCDYFFLVYLDKYLAIILGKNFKEKKDEFFLNYIGHIKRTFSDFQKKILKIKQKSFELYQDIKNKQKSLLEKYFESYYDVELRYFKYCSRIYINLIKKKLSTYFKKSISQDENTLFKIYKELNNEKIEEYLSFLKKSIYRCNLLSKDKCQNFKVNTLIRFALDQFDNFFEFITNHLKEVFNIKNNFIEPAVFKIVEYIFFFLLRFNISINNYVSFIKTSNHFLETDDIRQQILDKGKLEIITLIFKISKNICFFIKNLFENQSFFFQDKIFIFDFI